jgi:hypothetical protein
MLKARCIRYNISCLINIVKTCFGHYNKSSLAFKQHSSIHSIDRERERERERERQRTRRYHRETGIASYDTTQMQSIADIYKKNVPVIGEILMVYSYTSTHQRDVISSTSVSNSAYSERVYKT